MDVRGHAAGGGGCEGRASSDPSNLARVGMSLGVIYRCYDCTLRNSTRFLRSEAAHRTVNDSRPMAVNGPRAVSAGGGDGRTRRLTGLEAALFVWRCLFEARRKESAAEDAAAESGEPARRGGGANRAADPLRVSALDVVLFDGGAPSSWLFTSAVTGKVMRKAQRNVAMPVARSRFTQYERSNSAEGDSATQSGSTTAADIVAATAATVATAHWADARSTSVSASAADWEALKARKDLVALTPALSSVGRFTHRWTRGAPHGRGSATQQMPASLCMGAGVGAVAEQEQEQGDGDKSSSSKRGQQKRMRELPCRSIAVARDLDRHAADLVRAIEGAAPVRVVTLVSRYVPSPVAFSVTAGAAAAAESAAASRDRSGAAAAATAASRSPLLFELSVEIEVEDIKRTRQGAQRRRAVEAAAVKPAAPAPCAGDFCGWDMSAECAHEQDDRHRATDTSSASGAAPHAVEIDQTDQADDANIGKKLREIGAEARMGRRRHGIALPVGLPVGLPVSSRREGGGVDGVGIREDDEDDDDDDDDDDRPIFGGQSQRQPQRHRQRRVAASSSSSSRRVDELGRRNEEEEEEEEEEEGAPHAGHGGHGGSLSGILSGGGGSRAMPMPMRMRMPDVENGDEEEENAIEIVSPGARCGARPGARLPPTERRERQHRRAAAVSCTVLRQDVMLARHELSEVKHESECPPLWPPLLVRWWQRRHGHASSQSASAVVQGVQGAGHSHSNMSSGVLTTISAGRRYDTVAVCSCCRDAYQALRERREHAELGQLAERERELEAGLAGLAGKYVAPLDDDGEPLGMAIAQAARQGEIVRANEQRETASRLAQPTIVGDEKRRRPARSRAGASDQPGRPVGPMGGVGGDTADGSLPAIGHVGKIEPSDLFDRRARANRASHRERYERYERGEREQPEQPPPGSIGVGNARARGRGRARERERARRIEMEQQLNAGLNPAIPANRVTRVDRVELELDSMTNHCGADRGAFQPPPSAFALGDDPMYNYNDSGPITGEGWLHRARATGAAEPDDNTAAVGATSALAPTPAPAPAASLRTRDMARDAKDAPWWQQQASVARSAFERNMPGTVERMRGQAAARVSVDATPSSAMAASVLSRNELPTGGGGAFGALGGGAEDSSSSSTRQAIRLLNALEATHAASSDGDALDALRESRSLPGLLPGLGTAKSTGAAAAAAAAAAAPSAKATAKKSRAVPAPNDDGLWSSLIDQLERTLVECGSTEA